MVKTELARQYHQNGYGCAQAVLASFAPNFGLDEDLALKLATGFGSGMGRLCEVCGALTGAFMVIGLKHGKVKTSGEKYGTETETTYRLVRETAEKFQQRHGSIYCREIVGYDLNDPEQRAVVVQKGLFSSTCGQCIQDAVELLEEILQVNHAAYG